MATFVSHALRQLLQSQGSNPDNLAAEFQNWESLGQEGEYSSLLFGKDGAYSIPTVNGFPNVLRHVHLAPLANAVALARWEKDFRRRSRKTSDRALVYVSDDYHGHLLLYILDEPDAHAVARMATDDHRRLMLAFATIAERFVHTGEIIG